MCKGTDQDILPMDLYAMVLWHWLIDKDSWTHSLEFIFTHNQNIYIYIYIYLYIAVFTTFKASLYRYSYILIYIINKLMKTYSSKRYEIVFFFFFFLFWVFLPGYPKDSDSEGSN